MCVRKCRLVQIVDDKVLVTTVSARSVESAMCVRGYDLVGYNSHITAHPELEGAPIFSGLHGPSYDGPGVIRYETPEVYERLSH